MIKKPKITLIIITIALFFACGLTASAAIEMKHQINKTSSVENWELFKSNNEVDIFHKKVWVLDESSAIRKEVMIFKITNKTDKQIRVEWYLKTYYGSVCRSCNLNRPNEYEKSIILDPRQEIIGNENNIDQKLSILSTLEIDNFRGLDKVEFDDLSIIVLKRN